MGITQRVTVIEEYGERRDCLDQQWTVLSEKLGHTPYPLPNQITNVERYLNEISVDALVLTGGNDLTTVPSPSRPAAERDKFEEAVLEYAISKRVAVLGVCRGLELINAYFGGEIVEVSNHTNETHSINLDDERTQLQLPERAAVNSYHGYGIEPTGVADSLQGFATAPDSTVEGVVHESLPIWGIMWHPERESPSTSLDRHILDHVLGN
ncbi:gamma-glutamyl-gamma-aminobutyrate hydrolase family protein [Haloarcula nitratireducens]|uniref:Gamma-glutamyl-gamma-aminobutyrate hydrolase family protein n=1 Tax=Haloarcula nitratireducens TaxID=2487749 RepID=A0AAW4PKM3_9EURY|nr:gamma-glutamyl-gamma-aminobutyrate hydrolase family protein [Halomicroarcula nitratireducens]MBX0297762.1 gamma-glutamyl-gamma-aminobutyrate hydrolase family protein [Halomicroarcula nitratireducens]